MNTFQKYDRIYDQLLQLISTEKTGTPKRLAQKFGVSERTIYRYISELRLAGHKVFYSPNAETYMLVS